MANPKPSDVLATYTQDVARHDMMDPEKEKRIGEKAYNGDKEAQKKLVRANLRFVISVAKRYQRQGVEMNDLIQAGNIGIMHAAKKFDPSQGVRFISYAVYWIAQQIRKEIDATKGDVRASQTQMVRMRRIKRLQKKARQEKGRELTVQELMEETGYTEARIREALEYRAVMKSLNSPVDPNDDSTTNLAETLGEPNEIEPELAEEDRREIIEDALEEVLSERESSILQEYYGFGGKRELSLTEIGEKRGISRERARQLKERALKKLRQADEYHDLLKEFFTTEEDLEAREERLQEMDQEFANSDNYASSGYF